MAFDHHYFLDGNPILIGFHREMVRQYERGNRYRFLAEFHREMAHATVDERHASIEECFIWQHELLMTAYEATKAAEELRGLFAEVASARHDFSVTVAWPCPRVRNIKEQLDGTKPLEPYEYGSYVF